MRPKETSVEMKRIATVAERLDIGLDQLRTSISIGELPIVALLSLEEVKAIEHKDFKGFVFASALNVHSARGFEPLYIQSLIDESIFL